MCNMNYCYIKIRECCISSSTSIMSLAYLSFSFFFPWILVDVMCRDSSSPFSLHDRVFGPEYIPPRYIFSCRCCCWYMYSAEEYFSTYMSIATGNSYTLSTVEHCLVQPWIDTKYNQMHRSVFSFQLPIIRTFISLLEVLWDVTRTDMGRIITAWPRDVIFFVW